MRFESARLQIVLIHKELNSSFVLRRIRIKRQHTHYSIEHVIVNLLIEFLSECTQDADDGGDAVIFSVFCVTLSVHLLNSAKSLHHNRLELLRGIFAQNSETIRDVPIHLSVSRRGMLNQNLEEMIEVLVNSSWTGGHNLTQATNHHCFITLSVIVT